MESLWAAVVAVAGLLGTIAGLGKWILGEYFKKAEELEALKKSNQLEAIAELSSTVEDHKAELRRHSSKLDTTDKVIERANIQLQVVTDGLRISGNETAKRFERIDSELVRLSKDLVMIKSRTRKTTGG